MNTVHDFSAGTNEILAHRRHILPPGDCFDGAFFGTATAPTPPTMKADEATLMLLGAIPAARSISTHRRDHRSREEHLVTEYDVFVHSDLGILYHRQGAPSLLVAVEWLLAKVAGEGMAA